MKNEPNCSDVARECVDSLGQLMDKIFAKYPNYDIFMGINPRGRLAFIVRKGNEEVKIYYN